MPGGLEIPDRNAPSARPPRALPLAWAAVPAALAAVMFFGPIPAAAQTRTAKTTWTLTSDTLVYRSTEGVAVARGNVVVVSSSARLETDELELNTERGTVRAKGRVRLYDGPMTLWAEGAEYSTELSSGVLQNAYLENPPWRLWGRTLRRVSEDRYEVTRGALTSCDLDPPHYHFRGRRGAVVVDRRATLYGGALALERTPLLYTPFYTRSLRPRRWSLRVEPGRDSRKGYFAKTIFGYPLTSHTYGRLYLDYYQFTGTGFGGEYNYFLPDTRGSLYGYRIEDRLTDRQRYSVRAHHAQQITPQWSVHANGEFNSDPSFDNVYTRNNIEPVRPRAESEAGLTFHNAYYSARASVEQDLVFSTATQRFVRQKTSLPQLSLQTSPLLIGASVYATASASFLNLYTRPQADPDIADPIVPEKDMFRQTANSSFNLSREFRLSRTMTLVPRVGTSESWESWREVGGVVDPESLFQGRGFTGLNFRHRLTRALDYDLAHTYRVRWRPNTFRRDHAAFPDRGLEENSISLFASFRPAATFWARASSGYDLRVSTAQTIRTVREKITSPTVDLTFRPLRWLELFYRETYRLHPVRKPEITQFSIQVGESDKTRLTTGWSYNIGSPGRVQVRHGAAFFLTRGWWLDGGFAYNAIGPGGTRYDSVQIIEKNLVVRRDLHCWVAKLEMRQRPGVEEIFFNIDLKVNVKAQQLMASPEEKQFYPAREPEEP
jgi:hypothetical protein